GKLARLGSADVVEVQTVHKQKDPKIGKQILLWFRLSLSDLKKAKHDPAPVDLIYAGPVSKVPRGGRKKTGTTITLSQLHERRALNSDRFHHSMAQRFLL